MTRGATNFVQREGCVTSRWRSGRGGRPYPSWGQMLSLEGREYMRTQPGLAIYPGLAIGLLVFSYNLFGDALRDVLDPRLRGTR